MSTTDARLTAIENTLAALVAHLGIDEPAKVATAPKRKAPKAQPKAENDFHAWLVETAPARAERKVTNKALAAKLDDTRPGWRGASNQAAIWGAAKAGKRVPAVKK